MLLPSRPTDLRRLSWFHVSAGKTNCRYILTAVCPFSVWGWGIPAEDNGAEKTALFLVCYVLLDLGGFPIILRHGRSTSFSTSNAFLAASCMTRASVVDESDSAHQLLQSLCDFLALPEPPAALRSNKGLFAS